MNNSMSASALGIRLRTDGVDVVRVAAGETETFAVETDLTVGEDVKVLEESVYATPSLLGEYAQTVIVADSPRFTIVPDEVVQDAEALAAIASMMWPDADAETLNVSPAAYGASVVSVIGQPLAGFVGRTFSKARIVHRLAALCNVFASLSKPVNNIRLYARFSSSEHLDIVAMGGEMLLMANTFDCASPEDAVYFIMAAVKDCGFDPLEDELLLSGDESACRAVTDTLRKYVNSVMPLVLPEKMKDGPLELQIIGI